MASLTIASCSFGTLVINGTHTGMTKKILSMNS